MSEDAADAVSKALRRAWQLGQTYWQQADSDSYKQHALSEQTQAVFMDLVTETHATMAQAGAMIAAERERWQRIASAAQNVTTGCTDKIDYFELPSHLVAALALAPDEGPNLVSSVSSEPGLT